MDVIEDSFFVEFDNPLAFDVIAQAQPIKNKRNGCDLIREDVKVDIGPLANVSGQDAADQGRMKTTGGFGQSSIQRIKGPGSSARNV